MRVWVLNVQLLAWEVVLPWGGVAQALLQHLGLLHPPGGEGWEGACLKWEGWLLRRVPVQQC